MPHQVGQTVEIEGRLIPACNIQVENVPGFITHPDGSVHWYGVYFEIMFEDGSLWEISQGAEQEDFGEAQIENDVVFPQFSKITITEYGAWGIPPLIVANRETITWQRDVDNWVKFLEMYDAKLNRGE